MTRTIIAGILFICAGAIFFMFTKTTYDAMQPMKADIAQYDAALNKVNELKRLEQTLLTRYNSFDPNALDRLQKLLPDHVDNVRLILDIDHLAGQHGLALQNVVVSTPTATNTAADGEQIAGSPSSTQKYDSLTLQFSTVASYSEFIKFLMDLEQSLRIVDLVSLHLAPSGTPVKGDQMYTIDVTMRTYWLK
jgi:Tfp pilus assembly protein PilO